MKWRKVAVSVAGFLFRVSKTRIGKCLNAVSLSVVEGGKANDVYPKDFIELFTLISIIEPSVDDDAKEAVIVEGGSTRSQCRTDEPRLFNVRSAQTS